jgi:hypothetical protein
MNESHGLTCLDESRRRLVREKGFNGLDYIEADQAAGVLHLFFLDKAPKGLSMENVRISGGQRIREIKVLSIDFCRADDPELDDCMIVSVDPWGDFSTYTLCLVDLPDQLRFDPRYLCLEFCFTAGCPSDLDCRQTVQCQPDAHREPEIDYLAKDYASFRQLILDRLALTLPEWRETHIPDLGLALVEVLAYAGDHLSYFQDAVATEAYLETARQRISVRRHARLVDYRIHEGCNARAWLHLNTDRDLIGVIDPQEVYFITDLMNGTHLPQGVLTSQDLKDVPRDRYEVFELLRENYDDTIRLYQGHNKIHVYTWGDRQCCLPRDATRATLVDGTVEVVHSGDTESDDPKQSDPQTEEKRYERHLALKAGDFLLFEEVMGPQTGAAADADPGHRQVVRLTRVEPGEDLLTGTALLEIEWDREDALAFPLCISALGPPPECELLENISVARGNIFQVDHGQRREENLGTVALESSEMTCEAEELSSEVTHLPGPFHPTLTHIPLTFSAPLPELAPASRRVDQDPRQALPQVWLFTQPVSPSPPWQVRYDLLASGPDDRHYVVEMDNRRRTHLRFGDGDLGLRPAAGTAFFATYRVGSGAAGNVGAETIRRMVLRRTRLEGIAIKARNPLPAGGGTEPETLARIKQHAPHAFRYELMRAIAAQDYADIVMARFGRRIQRAAATLRWTGSWMEALVAVDPYGTYEPDTALLNEIADYLFAFRRIGHDVCVVPARHVPLYVKLTVCVQPGHLRGHVKQALLAEFSNRRLPDGRSGFFHPDQLTFGHGVRLSRLVARAQKVAGVAAVLATPDQTHLERLFEGPNGEVENGILPLAPFEIARLDNDPDFPENGVLELDLGCGR